MKHIFSFLKKPQHIKLAIAPEALVKLFENGQLHASEFQCLDHQSKRYVWKILLTITKAKIVNSLSQTTGNKHYAGS